MLIKIFRKEIPIRKLLTITFISQILILGFGFTSLVLRSNTANREELILNVLEQVDRRINSELNAFYLFLSNLIKLTLKR